MARRGQVSDGDMAAGRYNGASAISQPLIINGGLNWQLFSSIHLTVDDGNRPLEGLSGN